MFDYIKFEQPVFDNPSGTEFQTKDFECLLECYTVTAKGELYLECWDTEVVEEPESFAGFYIKRIPNTYRREYLTNYTGDVIFYNNYLAEYVAQFIDGKLRRLTFKSREWMNDTVLQQRTAVRESDSSSGSAERETPTS